MTARRGCSSGCGRGRTIGIPKIVRTFTGWRALLAPPGSSVANPGAGFNGVPHAPDFAADERAIGLGVRAMTGLLLSRLDNLYR
jgi:hypothetical protein